MKLEMRKWKPDSKLYELFIDGINIGQSVKIDDPIYPIWQSLIDNITDLESQVEKAAELKEAVGAIKQDDLCCISWNRDKGKWDVWREVSGIPEIHKIGHGNSIPAAFADYREKNPDVEPESSGVDGLIEQVNNLKTTLGNIAVEAELSNNTPLERLVNISEMARIANGTLSKAKAQPDRLEEAEELLERVNVSNHDGITEDDYNDLKRDIDRFLGRCDE